MIELATVGLIAKAAADAVSALDKVFRGYSDFMKEKARTQSVAPPADLAFVDDPENRAFIARERSTGNERQRVTYDELCQRLAPGDREYIETLTRSMQNYQKQWNAAYLDRSMASGMERGRLDAQLDFLAKEISEPLIKVLDFVEKMGLYLDDHYLTARDLAANYLANR